MLSRFGAGVTGALFSVPLFFLQMSERMNLRYHAGTTSNTYIVAKEDEQNAVSLVNFGFQFLSEGFVMVSGG